VPGGQVNLLEWLNFLYHHRRSIGSDRALWRVSAGQHARLARRAFRLFDALARRHVIDALCLNGYAFCAEKARNNDSDTLCKVSGLSTQENPVTRR
jgi:hypothetical protein